MADWMHKNIRDMLSLQAAATPSPTAKDKNLKPDFFHQPTLLPQDQEVWLQLLTPYQSHLYPSDYDLDFAYRIRGYLPFFCSFMNFINNNMCDSMQSQITFQPSQQHTSSAVQESGSWGLEQ